MVFSQRPSGSMETFTSQHKISCTTDAANPPSHDLVEVKTRPANDQPETDSQQSSNSHQCNHISIESRSGDDDSRTEDSMPWSFFRVGRRVHRSSHGKRPPTAETEQSSDSLVKPSLWSMQDFDFEKEVGRGHYGYVVMANYKQGSNKVAVKRLSKRKIIDDARKGGKALRLLRREIEIHSHLRHLNITRFHGYYDDPKNVYMVMNYASLGNLHYYIHTVENGVVPLERARLYLRQVASALEYLGSAKVAHRDLKQENLVLTTRNTIQICDFGWAINYHNEKRKTLCGTPLYVPPEMLRNVPYDPRFVDSWALGILAHELILNESPFDLQDKEWDRCSSDDNRAQRKLIFDKIEHFNEWKAPDKGESRAMSFISAFLQKDPKERMNAADALGHPFLLDQESLDEKLPVFKTPNTRHTRRSQPALAKRRKLSRRDTEHHSLSFDGKENTYTLHKRRINLPSSGETSAPMLNANNI